MEDEVDNRRLWWIDRALRLFSRKRGKILGPRPDGVHWREIRTWRPKATKHPSTCAAFIFVRPGPFSVIAGIFII
jgi:hypothetical protein